MKIRVLGCSGGIGGQAATTSFLVDHDVLIDAGTGICALSLSELVAIDHVFLTHSHMDHIAGLPLMNDSAGPLRDKPLTVHGLPDTIKNLRNHILNGKIWPDFTQIPSVDMPFLRLVEMVPGTECEINGRIFRSVAVTHTIPAVGYIVRSSGGSWAFGGDTTTTDLWWKELNAIDDLKYLVCETTFTDEQRALAEIACHLCPSLLAIELEKLKVEPEIYLTHLMPGEEEHILDEVRTQLGEAAPQALVRDQLFEI